MAIGSAAKEKPKKQAGVLNMLGPGFRFHPTDEELVRYYLRRKVCGKGFRIDAISDIDIYKKEPWDLPSFSKLPTRDLEWYFFSMLDKKYDNGAKTNRATEKGYWKTTGKDRAVYHRGQIVGMKKTLVYHMGRAPKGQRTNWVMHEYRLEDLELERAGVAQDAFVLCRVFQKSGTGPKNGEQYGAPFVEEEWEDDMFEPKPQVEAAAEVDYGEDACLDGDDLKQILGAEVHADATSQLNLQSSDGSGCEEVVESFNCTQQLLAHDGEQYHESQQLDDGNLYYTLAPCDTDVKQVKHEYIGESSVSGDCDDISYLLDEPIMDTYSDLQFASEQYFDAHEFTNTIETNNDTSAFAMADEFLSFVDSNDSIQQNLAFDSPMMLGDEAVASDQTSLLNNVLHEGTNQGTTSTSGNLTHGNVGDAPSPSNKLDSARYEYDFEYPQFIDKQTSQTLGSLPAPPAFASEYSSKDKIHRLSSLSLPSSSVHVTAGIIQIRMVNANGTGRHESLEKPWNINIVLSFGYYSRIDHDYTNVESSASEIPGKAISLLSSGLFCYLFFWALLFSMSLKAKAFVFAQ